MIKVANEIWEGAPAHSLPPALPLVSARHGKALCCRHILHWRTCSTSTEGAATPVCPSPSTKLILTTSSPWAGLPLPTDKPLPAPAQPLVGCTGLANLRQALGAVQGWPAVEVWVEVWVG